MEEDSFSQLLRQHFMKVSQCLEDHTNFNKLTRYSFCSSSDKAIDHTEYGLPELEYPTEEPETITLSNPTLSSLEDSPTVKVEEEIKSNYVDKNFPDLAISSEVDSNKEPKIDIIDAEHMDVPSEKFRREHFLDRPETPMLKLYDLDESDVCSLASSIPPVGKIESSRKFIHSVSLPQLNDSVSCSEDQIVLSVSNFDELDDEAVHSTIFDSIHSNDFEKLFKNEKSFEDELERYKKDIKVEKAIRSLSVNDTAPRVRSKSKNISSCDSCFKACKKEERKVESRVPMFDEFSDHNRLYEIEPEVEVPPNFANTAEYLKYLLEESNTTVYHGLMNSKSSSSLFQNKKSDEVMDDDMIESVLTKFMKSHINDGKSTVPVFPEALVLKKEVGRNTEIPSTKEHYVKMNHLEIQKELTRRIEDMYKAGDGN